MSFSCYVADSDQRLKAPLIPLIVSTIRIQRHSGAVIQRHLQIRVFEGACQKRQSLLHSKHQTKLKRLTRKCKQKQRRSTHKNPFATTLKGATRTLLEMFPPTDNLEINSSGIEEPVLSKLPHEA